MKDFLGQELMVGDRVVYGASLGRCAAVGVGIIKELKQKPANADPWDNSMTVKIKPEKTQSNWDNEHTKDHKVRWFAFSERMVKIPSALVQQHFDMIPILVQPLVEAGSTGKNITPDSARKIIASWDKHRGNNH